MLEVIVFVSGAVVMILELVGSRVLAPFLGTSIVVWTSLIGIILGSLSIGYWYGGKVADQNPNYKTFSLILLGSSILIAAATSLKLVILLIVTRIAPDPRIGSVIASAVLFAPASIMLGMVSPYAVRLKMKDVRTSGKTVGNLYAISTAGSIVGTFLAGFFLISYFGNTKILFSLAITLVMLSILAYGRSFFKAKMWLLGFFLSGMLFDWYAQVLYAKQGFIDVDTRYNRVRIYNTVEKKTQKPMRMMEINKEANSAIFLQSDEIVFDYIAFYRLAKHFHPFLQNSLMIGGAGYAYPQEYLKQFPKARMDVVEIDPKLTALAKRYFRLKESPRLTIYHEDGRTFLNRTNKQYDVIFSDAYKSFYSIPYQLTTYEAVRKMHDALFSDGVVLVNIISAIEGEKGQFLRAEYATFASVFPKVYLFPVTDEKDGKLIQNIILVALKSRKTPLFVSQDKELHGYLKHLWKKSVVYDMPILTDDYAPVDQYIAKML